MKNFLLLFCLPFFSVQAWAQPCVANFSFDDTNLTIQFTDLSTTTSGSITSWFWDFDDGTTSTQQNPLHTYTEADNYNVQLTITTAGGCEEDITQDVDICELGINVTQGACNGNNQVPLTITVIDLFDNANEIDITVDGNLVPGGPFDIEAGEPVTVFYNVPGDGLNHIVSVQSLDIGTCNETVNVQVTDCGSNCFLNSLAVNFAGGGTTNITVGPGGNNSFAPQSVTITLGTIVHFVWADGGHTSTSDATSGPDSWATPEFGPGATFDVTIHDPGIHNYYCVPHGGPGGAGMSGNIVANCPAGNNFTLNITFNTTLANPSGYNLLIDGVVQPGSPHPYIGTGTQSTTATLAGDGLTHLIKIVDVTDPTCEVMTNFIAPNCGAQPQCNLTVSASITGGCNAQNQVPVAVTVTAINAGTQSFNLKVDGVPVPGGPFPYTSGGPTTVTINIAGNGQSHTIEAVDVATPTCIGSTTLTTTNCNIPCSISNLTAISGTSTTHSVLVQDFNFSPQNLTITAGDLVQWNWTGQIAHTSTSDATSGASSWNSGLLNTGATFTSPVLAAGVHPYYCIPHGAPGGIGMAGTITVQANCTNGNVLISLNFNESGGSFNGFQVLVDGIPVDTFAYAANGSNSVSVPMLGNGQSHSLQVQDLGNAACAASTSVSTPDCSFTPPCSINLTATQSGTCNGNNVSVTLTVSAANAGNGFNLTIDGTLYSGNPVSYAASGNTFLTLTLPGDGQNHTFAVSDLGDPACTDNATLTFPNCSTPCTMNNLTLSTGGSSNPVTHTVLVKDFFFEPQHLNVTTGDLVKFQWTGAIPHTATSDATSGPLVFNSGLLGNGAVYEVAIPTDGTHPYYCIPHGAPGGIGMAGTLTAGPPCVNGQVSVSASFSIINGGSGGYNVRVDGNLTPGSPYTYTSSINSVTLQIPGDGQSHSVLIEDVNSPSCSVSGSILSPQCSTNAPCSLEVVAVQTSPCNSQNQIGVQLTLTHSNTGTSGFNVKVSGLLVPGSPFAYDPDGTTVLTIPVTGTGQERVIIVEDTDSTTCTAQTTILTPLCGTPCEILNLTAVGNATHTVEVKDFEFSPANLSVVVGDTVNFVWTGVIPHTATSDDTSGANSWNSGLLGNGAHYQVVISAAGEHPYYCIPHGGPSGIGMAGVIQAVQNCDNGIASIAVSFNVTNGSPLGYRVFVDGEQVGGIQQYQNPAGANSTVLEIPGDGMTHLLTVQDLEVNFCAATASFIAPSCPVTCLVENLTATTGGNVLHEVEVTDFEFVPNDLTVRTGETIRFIWTGVIPHSTTSDAISGPDAWNSGVHGAGFSYEISLLNPGEHPFYCIPHGGPGGIGQSGVLHATEDCEGGMVQVSLQFSVTSGSAQGFRVFVDGQLLPGSPFQYDDPTGENHLFISLPGDGLTHNITVQDMQTGFCAATTQITLPDCNAGCEISGLAVVFPQPMTHTVKVVDFAFSPQNLSVNLGDTVKFFWTGQIPHTATSDATSGPDAFNSGLLGNGATYFWIPTTAGEHPYYCIPHGGPNGIGMAGMVVVENGNAPQNGQVTATLTFSGTNTGSGFNLYVDGVLQAGSPFPYTASGNVTLDILLPCDGLSHEVKVVDFANPDCSQSIMVTSPQCDGNCALSAHVAQNGGCAANGQVPYILTVQSSNAGSSFFLKIDGAAAPGSPFNYDPDSTTTLPLNLPGDGALHTLEVSDSDSTGCTDIFEITTPDCSPDCVLNASAQQSGNCNANGNVPFHFTVQASNGSASFTVKLDSAALPGSPFNYDPDGTTTLPFNLPGDGSLHTLLFTDSDNSNCSATVTVQAPDCLAACALGVLQIEIGAQLVHIVEVRDFDFLPVNISVSPDDTVRFVWTGIVPHTATSDAASGTDSWNSGLLGQGSSYDVVIQAEGEHPYYCIPHGGPGGIGMAGNITAVSACEDGSLAVQAVFASQNTSVEGYHLFVNNVPQAGNPQPYSPDGVNVMLLELPGNGQPVTLLVQDPADPACQSQQTFTMPECNDPCFGYTAEWTADIDHLTFEVKFENTSSVAATGFLWTFGDDDASVLENPVHAYDEAETYEVCLILSGTDCTDTFCQTITVGEYFCEANFSYEFDGLTLTLLDQSTTTEPVTEWMWNFGDNHFIVGTPNPTYTYAALGVYTICLNIEAGQCQDDTCITLDLTDPCLTFQPDFAYTIDTTDWTVQFVDLTGGSPNQWLWGFGDGNTSNSENPAHSYDGPGYYNVCLLVQNTTLGCNESHCEVVSVGVTGVKDLKIRNWKLAIYPNPSALENFVWTMEGIRPADFGSLLDLTMYDMQGKTLLRTQVQGEELVVFSSAQRLGLGVYFVELRTGEGVVYRGKVVVQ